MTNMHRAMAQLKSLLYRAPICASVLCLEAGSSFGLSFCWFPLSSRIRRPLFSFSGGRRKKRMEDGRICKLCYHQRRGRGVSHRLSVKECSPSPTHTHTYTHRTLNRTLSFDTHWLASTHNPPNHTNICINWFNTHANAHMYLWEF